MTKSPAFASEGQLYMGVGKVYSKLISIHFGVSEGQQMISMSCERACATSY